LVIDVVTAGLIVGNADSHNVLGQPEHLCSTLTLWELVLPAMRPARTTQTSKIDVEADGLIVGNADSHRVLGQPEHLCSTLTLWELALPAMRPARTTQSSKIDVEADGLIVGKPTPTRFWASHSLCARRGPCGSWLCQR